MVDPRNAESRTAALVEASPVALAVEAAGAVIGERRRLWRREYTLLVAVAFIIAAFAFAFYVLDADPARLRQYGYVGVFLIPLIGSASFVLPMPGLLVIAGGGATLDPVFGVPAWIVVGVVAGLGETIGELTGYAAGYGGSAVLEERRFFARLNRWMQRRGSLVMFAMSALPNPLFDVAGVIAGAVRMPIWKFFVAVLCGKVIKSLYVAGAGVLGWTLFERWFS